MDTNALKRFAQEARQNLKKTITSKLKFVLADDSLARRESQRAVLELEKRLRLQGEERVIEQVAYTWFNRFTALQFMDMNNYNRIRVVAPADGQTRPEILAEANSGVFDNAIISENTQQIITALLDGRSASNDPENEAYRHLLVAVCNHWHSSMPFMFERIADFTELLIPEDLLSSSSVLADLRAVMTAENCADVEAIGWLYQFYISEKKDEVFEGLRKNKKVIPENIPAATQLFTPHWIVKYLVQNSLGRLWMLNRPESALADKMEYYIAPEEPEPDFLQITSPEEIKVCDPAVGSGHMLTYAFDLLYAIYEEVGYDSTEIPSLILENNLYGIELDQRAGALAAFALTMKARSKHPRFFSRKIVPNICVLENISFETEELREYVNAVGCDLFTAPLRATLTQFEEADNFGSLIQPELQDVETVRRHLESKDITSNLLLKSTHDRVLKVLRQADYLSSKYHVVVANPPYMGGKGMNGRLGAWIKEKYPDVKSDLFSAFIVRNTYLAVKGGQLGFMTPFVWMFISSYEKLRFFLLKQKTITNLIQLEYSGFDGATVPICTFTIENKHRPDLRGGYIRLSDFRGAKNQAPKTLEAIQNPKCGWFYRASANDFEKIPGRPIAYWMSGLSLQAFSKGMTLGKRNPAKQGFKTGNNDRFLRVWFEVSANKASFAEKIDPEKKWFPCVKGGEFRRWYGNYELLVNWEKNGEEIKNYRDETGKQLSRPQNLNSMFKIGATWSSLTSGRFSARALYSNFCFESKGSALTVSGELEQHTILGFMNSKIFDLLISSLAPTLDYSEGAINKVPLIEPKFNKAIIPELLESARNDWNDLETSWDFGSLPILSPDHRGANIAETYAKLRTHWQSMTDYVQRLEEENNEVFIDAYGLQSELTPEVSVNKITLTCNPHYRYRENITDEEREARLLSDTIAEFLSYAVGCMFGRYALEKPGLILANAKGTLEDYFRQIPEPSFLADDDNVIPILDSEWFDDDIVGRFRRFLRVTFGDEHFEENLRYIETAIGRSIRNYFVKDFYKEHVQRYKKRPIYWQFSSPKGSFNALIYMHRYNRDTVSTILNNYLREFKAKLTAERSAQERVEISGASTAGEKTKALKEIVAISAILTELEEWERDVLYPLATQRIEIDLDDGVKANYPKFGNALKTVAGLS
ncbi:BREX-1 system adenine-specific DNA-methyltransferase PglX [Alphaproteobacteria bacterium]|nr:BREX-1 system adenine-specific DNA-methyltransferase PglX [Alphaproteobacteria bacterium]